MSRFARKVDRGQSDIVDALEARDALVEPTLARVGGGVPDLLVGYRGALALFEVKPGEDPDRSTHELNENEQNWHLRWAGYPVFRVLDPEQAVAVLDAYDACGHWPKLYRTNP